MPVVRASYMRIPPASGHGIHGKPATQSSTRNWRVIPRQPGLDEHPAWHDVTSQFAFLMLQSDVINKEKSYV